MRPRELTLAGFRSYRERTTFDFRGRRLVGVVGPIGSGKSSLLDAITFALYGKTPVFERDTRSLIHQLADAAQVELVFEVDGQVWRAQRGLRRKGQSQHKLERLSDDGPDPEVLETVVQERATRDRVVQLLGLDFDAFCRSVMLAQNRFAQFLRATPTQRNEVLKGVFGYERFDRALARVRERAAAAQATIDAIDDEARRLVDAKSALGQARDDAAAAGARSAAFEERWDEVATALEAAAGAAAAVARLEERAAALGEVASSLPDGRSVRDAAEAAARTDDRLAAAGAAVAEAEAAAATAVAERDAVTAGADQLPAFERLVARLDTEVATLAATEAAAETVAEERARAEAAAAEADDAVTAADAARTGAEAQLAAAEEARSSAGERLHEARHAVMASTLRDDLRTGEPCPVCAQPVATLPPAAATPVVAVAETVLDAAEGDATRARDVLAAASAEVATRIAHHEAAVAAVAAAVERVAAADAGLAAATAALTATRSELVDRLGDGDPRELLDERERERRAAEEAAAAAQAEAAEARAHLAQAREDGDAATAALGRLASKLGNAWGRLGDDEDVPATPDGLREGFVRLAESIQDRLAAAAADAESAGAAGAEAEAALADAREVLGVPPGGDLVEARSDARATSAAAAQRVEGLEAVVAAAGDLDARLAAATDARDLAKRLAADLQPSRFLAFLLEEERAALAELGSTHLEELTAAAFRFADDDTFAIADQNAGGAVRTPESLSGGETFLASLALALALAEMVARGGGRLDAFFLDEGFGSLDPDHIDRAMEGIERLVAAGPDRLVIVVSHVEQMRRSIEDLIELDKDPRTGDTRVVGGAVLATSPTGAG